MPPSGKFTRRLFSLFSRGAPFKMLQRCSAAVTKKRGRRWGTEEEEAENHEKLKPCSLAGNRAAWREAHTFAAWAELEIMSSLHLTE